MEPITGLFSINNAFPHPKQPNRHEQTTNEQAHSQISQTGSWIQSVKKKLWACWGVGGAVLSSLKKWKWNTNWTFKIRHQIEHLNSPFFHQLLVKSRLHLQRTLKTYFLLSARKNPWAYGWSMSKPSWFVTRSESIRSERIISLTYLQIIRNLHRVWPQ